MESLALVIVILVGVSVALIFRLRSELNELDGHVRQALARDDEGQARQLHR
jgi:hypothetical protein